jgi:hypothetical protein
MGIGEKINYVSTLWYIIKPVEYPALPGKNKKITPIPLPTTTPSPRTLPSDHSPISSTSLATFSHLHLITSPHPIKPLHIHNPTASRESPYPPIPSPLPTADPPYPNF